MLDARVTVSIIHRLCSAGQVEQRARGRPLSEVLRSAAKRCGALRSAAESAKCCRVLRSTTKCCEVQRSAAKHWEVLRITAECCEALKSTVECCETVVYGHCIFPFSFLSLLWRFFCEYKLFLFLLYILYIGSWVTCIWHRDFFYIFTSLAYIDVRSNLLC